MIALVFLPKAQSLVKGQGLLVLGFRHQMLSECRVVFHNCRLIDQNYDMRHDSGYNRDCRSGTTEIRILAPKKTKENGRCTNQTTRRMNKPTRTHLAVRTFKRPPNFSPNCQLGSDDMNCLEQEVGLL